MASLSYASYLRNLVAARGVGGLFVRAWHRGIREMSALQAVSAWVLGIGESMSAHRAVRSIRRKARTNPEAAASGQSRRRRFLDVELNGMEFRRLIQRVYPHETTMLLRDARALADGRALVLGHSVTLASPPDWHRDPRTGSLWALRSPERIQIASAGRPADVKYVWELNRHQHLAIFGLAYRITGEEDWLERAASHLESWIEQNPVGLGINWKSAMEVAIRAIAWTVMLALANDADVILGPERRRSRLLRSLHDHLMYLERHLSPEYDQRNNHSIGEAAGLVIGGLFFPEFEEAERWYLKGMALLQSELAVQIEPDGADFEHSTSYHRFVAEFGFIVWRAHRSQGIELPWLARILERMTDYLVAMQRPDGRIVAFGDGDEGRGFLFSHRSGYDVRHLVSAAAVILQRGDFKTASGGLDWEAFHLLGPSAVDAFERLMPATPVLSPAFDSAGFYVMRDGWDADSAHCVVDCGYIGSGGHGHNDQLSFEFSVCGLAWVVDSGTFAYLEDDEWRRFFRSTAAHTTLQIDDLEAAEFGYGHFQFNTRPNARIREWMSSSQFDRVSGELDAYKRLTPPVSARREIILLKESKALLVRDRLDGLHGRRLTLRFQLAPGASVELRPPVCRLTHPATLTELDFLLDDKLEWAVVEGWISATYGRREPRPVLRGTAILAQPVELDTFIAPVARGETLDGSAMKRKFSEVVG